MSAAHAVLISPCKEEVASEAKRVGVAAELPCLCDPLPDPPPFKGREQTRRL